LSPLRSDNISGRIIFYLCSENVCGHFQNTFSREGPQRKTASAQRAEHARLLLRDASSPEGENFLYLPVSTNKAPPSGELARQRLRGYNKKGARTFRYEHLIVQE
jgi:hypothetical protein